MNYPYANSQAVGFIRDSSVASKVLELALKRTTITSFEHRTSSIVSVYLNHFFPVINGWVITPEQSTLTNNKPDFSVEGQYHTNSNHHLNTSTNFLYLTGVWNTGVNTGVETLRPAIFVECKSASSSDNFKSILNQINDAIIANIGDSKIPACYAIAIKGTKIAFFTFIPDEEGLEAENYPHYKGFTSLPSTYTPPQESITLLPETMPLDDDNNAVAELWDTALIYHQPYIEEIFLHIYTSPVPILSALTEQLFISFFPSLFISFLISVISIFVLDQKIYHKHKVVLFEDV